LHNRYKTTQAPDKPTTCPRRIFRFAIETGESTTRIERRSTDPALPGASKLPSPFERSPNVRCQNPLDQTVDDVQDDRFDEDESDDGRRVRRTGQRFDSEHGYPDLLVTVALVRMMLDRPVVAER